MSFPKSLITNSRKTYPEKKIHSLNFMYCRHKPGSQWVEGDDYPDFSQIRADQSFNWSAFSTPDWVRYNDQKRYLDGYGVMGYSVKTIRNPDIYNDDIPLYSYGVKHNPCEYNYSHCEAYNNKRTKPERRDYRMLLKHNCKRLILPNRDIGVIEKTYHYFEMLIHRLLVYLK